MAHKGHICDKCKKDLPPEDVYVDDELEPVPRHRLTLSTVRATSQEASDDDKRRIVDLHVAAAIDLCGDCFGHITETYGVRGHLDAQVVLAVHVRSRRRRRVRRMLVQD